MHQVRLYCWHFMAYPHLPPDFDDRYESGWVTVPNALWDRERSAAVYQEYIDQLVYAEELGFDGLVLNEHHQNVYGLMPAVLLYAALITVYFPMSSTNGEENKRLKMHGIRK